MPTDDGDVWFGLNCCGCKCMPCHIDYRRDDGYLLPSCCKCHEEPDNDHEQDDQDDDFYEPGDYDDYIDKGGSD